jgi:hypothetical protein
MLTSIDIDFTCWDSKRRLRCAEEFFHPAVDGGRGFAVISFNIQGDEISLPKFPNDGGKVFGLGTGVTARPSEVVCPAHRDTR